MTGWDRVARFVASGFGSGFVGPAPGTSGTAAAALLVWLLSHTSLPPGWTLLSLAAASTAGCLLLGRRVERLAGAEDPGFFVLDEFAGYFVALLAVWRKWPGAPELLAAFVLFRLFDIAKPQPCRWAQGLGGGVGIVLDDLFAGAYALCGVAVFRSVLEKPPW